MSRVLKPGRNLQHLPVSMWTPFTERALREHSRILRLTVAAITELTKMAAARTVGCTSGWPIPEAVSCQHPLYKAQLWLVTSLVLKSSLFRTTNNLVTGNYKLFEQLNYLCITDISHNLETCNQTHKFVIHNNSVTMIASIQCRLCSTYNSHTWPLEMTHFWKVFNNIFTFLLFALW